MTGIPDDALDDLILRWLEGSLGQLEERRLVNWLRSSPENQRRFERLATVWSLEPPRTPEPRPIHPNPDLLMRQAESRRTRTRLRRRLAAGGRTWGAASVAAAALLVVVLGIRSWRSAPTPVFSSAEITAGDSGSTTTRLADGSIVRLAPGSTLRLEPHASVRQVFLRGRGYFTVEGDERRPFVVRTTAGNARVLGTQFEIRVGGDRLRLSVVEGRVALVSGAATVQIQAGEVSYARTDAAPEVIRVDGIREMIEGTLVYKSLPLKHVAQDLELHFQRRIEIADSMLAAREFTGSFAGERFEAVIGSICRAVAARCTLTGADVVMQPRAGPARPLQPNVDLSSTPGGKS